MLTIDQPYGNHNGGNVTIGPDGMLYIGMGDGGSGGDPERRALNVTSMLGKILRIDPTPSAGAPYTVPPDNPFVGVDGARPEIWSVGVRNPWRMSFDPATGDLWFGDVGQGAIEEIDVAWAADGAGRGINFGWSAFEGSSRFNEDQPPDGATPPIYEYEHGEAGCSVSGGAVYRGAAIPALVGWFVYGDYCSGNLYALARRGPSGGRHSAAGQLAGDLGRARRAGRRAVRAVARRRRVADRWRLTVVASRSDVQATTHGHARSDVEAMLALAPADGAQLGSAFGLVDLDEAERRVVRAVEPDITKRRQGDGRCTRLPGPCTHLIDQRRPDAATAGMLGDADLIEMALAVDHRGQCVAEHQIVVVDHHPTAAIADVAC